METRLGSSIRSPIILAGIDPEKPIAANIRNALKPLGHVVLAGTFEEAAAKLDIARFDAVFLDEDLPGPSAWGLIRLIKNGLYCAFLPMLALMCRDEAVPLYKSEATARGVGLVPYSRLDELATLREVLVPETRPRVLVIDDDLRTLRLTAIALQVDFDVDTAADGASGLAAYSATRYDVIVLDLNLPDGHGRDLMQTMSSKIPCPPIIILTADHSTKSQLELVTGGAYNYLTKPLSMQKLLADCHLAIGSSSVDTARKAQKKLDKLHGLLVAADRTITCGRTHAGVIQLRTAIRRSGATGIKKEDVLEALRQLENDEQAESEFHA